MISGTESRGGAPHTPLPEKIYQYSVIVKSLCIIGTESVLGQNCTSAQSQLCSRTGAHRASELNFAGYHPFASPLPYA